MEEILNSLYYSSTTPVFSAFLLGLMTAISPCPLATNITAMGFISRDLENRNRIFINGVIYTLGRVVSYTGLAVILFLGADQFSVSSIFQQYGEKILGPLLIIIGTFMLGIVKVNLNFTGKLTARFQKKNKHNYLDAFFLGIIFALAFCPYSGILYFGMLIPMTIQSASGLILPVIFAIATAIPVLIFAWLLAYTVSGVGKLYNSLKTFEFWFRKIVATAFILVGLYLTVLVWFS